MFVVTHTPVPNVRETAHVFDSEATALAYVELLIRLHPDVVTDTQPATYFPDVPARQSVKS